MAILLNTKKRVVINAGHWTKDSGSSGNGLIERDYVAKVRDELLPILNAQGFEVFSVPDELDLSKSIAFANAKVPTLNDGFCLDIHLNASGDPKAKGVEAFYGESDTSKQIAEVLSQYLSIATGFKDRGAKKHTEAHAGSLGWIVFTKGWASLVECGFITSVDDSSFLKVESSPKKVAIGIANGICTIYGLPLVSDNQSIKEGIAESVEIIKTETAKIEEAIKLL